MNDGVSFTSMSNPHKDDHLISADNILGGKGAAIYELAKRLFPICRSLTGDGVRETLGIIKEHLPDLQIHEVASGTKCFDWEVPLEWNIHSAWIVGPDGRWIINFYDNNLHVVGYSEPIDKTMDLEELQQHLHSLSDKPDVIPYVTSYYERRWGFCLTHNKRKQLKQGIYRAIIKSTLKPGSMTYADLVIPGSTDHEILISTYICHPSLANNELSGPCVTTYLAKWIQSRPRTFTYRFVFVPETIGSIYYISRHLDHLKRKVVGGFQVTCVGDNRCYSYLPTRIGNTRIDRLAKHVLKHTSPDYRTYTWLVRGSDERQWCAPGVDLPIVSIMRSKYGTYPEYHTSADNLDLISPEGLNGGYEAIRRCIECIESDRHYRCQVLCEPQMGKRGLYGTLGFEQQSAHEIRDLRMNILTYCDGNHSMLDIAEKLHVPAWALLSIIDELVSHGLIA